MCVYKQINIFTCCLIYKRKEGPGVGHPPDPPKPSPADPPLQTLPPDPPSRPSLPDPPLQTLPSLQTLHVGLSVPSASNS